MNGKLWSLALAGTILSLVAAPASTLAAQTAEQTVTVGGCMARSAVPAQNWMSPFNTPMTEPGTPAMVVVDFTNVAANPLSQVEFAVVSNGKAVTMVRDNGSFAPNARVMHGFVVADNVIPAGGEVTCVPVRAKFSDGTTWMNPTMPAH